MIKFGLKLWSTDVDLLPEAEKLVDTGTFKYVELTPIPGTEASEFRDYDFEYIIHMTTERQGFNISDNSSKDANIKTINENINWADKLNAKYTILHPGFGKLDAANEVLEELNDKRIIIENMPKKGFDKGKQVLMNGVTPEDIEALIGTKFGFCLDFSHAIKAAISLKNDYKEFIKEFIRLKPKMFHVSGGNTSVEFDEHLDLSESNYDFEFLMQCAKKTGSTHLTLETPKTGFPKKEIENVELLKKYI